MEQYSKNDIISVRITDMGKDGEGIGKIDGFPFFIKGAVIGDLVEASVMKVKKGYAFARLLRVIEPSENRVDPVCPVSDKCGGCQIMNMSYEAQLAFKQKKVLDVLEHIGGIDRSYLEENVLPIMGMEEPYRYRNKAVYPVGVGRDGRSISGFFAHHSHRIVEHEDCSIGPESNAALLRAVLDWMDDQGIGAYDEETGRGRVRHVMIRQGYATGQCAVTLVVNEKCEWFNKHKDKADALVRALVDAEAGLSESAQVDSSEREPVSVLGNAPVNELENVPVNVSENGSVDMATEVKIAEEKSPDWRVVSVTINENREKGNRILGDKELLLYGTEYIEDELMGLTFRISAQSFYQVNPLQTRRLYETAIEFADLTGDEEVWDVCCGIGTISLAVASRLSDKGRVHGIEIVDRAIEDAKVNAKINGIKNADFICAAAEDYLVKNRDKIRADVVILDPPRKGMDPEAIDAILTVKPDRIVYVSCDPATLARDVKLLNAGGYELKRLRACDMFGHSCHVECVTLLQRMSNTRERTITLDVEMEDYHRIKNRTEVTADATE